MPTLSEADSKALLRGYGVPVPEEQLARDPSEAAAAAESIGYPVVVKLCGNSIAHKTERGLVRLNLTDAAGVEQAARDLLALAGPQDGTVGLLVAPMVRGSRELIAGLSTDPTFGTTVMLGVGGVLAEAVADVSFRLVPIARADAFDMMDDLSSQALFGPFRGEPAIDRERLADVLMALSSAAGAEPGLRSVDLNPLIVLDGVPLAVDALVEIEE